MYNKLHVCFIFRVPIAAVITKNLDLLDEILKSDRFSLQLKLELPAKPIEDKPDQSGDKSESNIDSEQKDQDALPMPSAQGDCENNRKNEAEQPKEDMDTKRNEEAMDCDKEGDDVKTEQPKEDQKGVNSQCNEQQMELNMAMLSAISSRQPVMLDKLLKAGADIHAFDSWYPVLHSIVDLHCMEMFDIAVKYATNLHVEGYYGNLLNSAARTGSLTFVKKVFDLGVDKCLNCEAYGGSPLHEAIRHVPYTEKQNTPEGQVKTFSNTQIKYDTSTIQFLIEHGCPIDGKDLKEKTALHDAAILGNECVVECLVKAGANIDTIDSEGYTPWMYAALYHFDNLLEYLYDECFLHKPVTKDGISLAQFTCQHDLKKALEFLLEKGADPFTTGASCTPLTKAIEQCSFQCIKVLINQPKARLHVCDINYKTPFQKIMSKFSEYDNPSGREVMEMCLQRGSKIDEVDENGETALIQVLDHDYHAIRWLLSHGANPDHTMPDGKYPLLIACQHEDREALEILLECGADISITDRSDETNMTPLQTVLRTKNYEMIEICLISGFSLSGVHDMLRLDQDLLDELNNDSNETRSLIKYIQNSPHRPISLRGLSRIAVLKYIGVKNRNDVVPKLGLPKVLEDYLDWNKYYQMRKDDLNRIIAKL